MFDKLKSGMTNTDITTRSEELKSLAKMVGSAAKNMGLAPAGCRTICEERLVVVNGKLRREVVCRTVCS